MSSPDPNLTACCTNPPLAVDRDPVEQWLRWEEQANLPGFRTSTLPIDLPVAAIPAEHLRIRLADSTPREIERRFFRRGLVLYPKHPLNADPSVAYFAEPATEVWQARFTSSRTLVVADPGGLLCSVKLPTDHPHPHFVQPEKTKLREEAEDALRWTALFERVDATLGPDPALLLLREVIAVMVPGSESAYLVRDLTPLQDGNFYLPALSLPWWGRPIANLHGADFEEFWGVYYAEAIGRAKAKLLMRYGLQYETPNPQNLLIQLARDLRPTGVIALRDLGDLNPVAPLATAGVAPWIQLQAELKPETQNSFWAFDSADEQRISAETLGAWYARHDRAYEAALREFCLPGGPGQQAAEAPRDLSNWTAFLRSARGATTIQAAFERRARAWQVHLSQPRDEGEF